MFSDFTSKEKVNTCFPFTSNRKETFTPWNINPIFNPTKRSFSARLGPAGGKRGYRYLYTLSDENEMTSELQCLYSVDRLDCPVDLWPGMWRGSWLLSSTSGEGSPTHSRWREATTLAVPSSIIHSSSRTSQWVVTTGHHSVSLSVSPHLDVQDVGEAEVRDPSVGGGQVHQETRPQPCGQRGQVRRS